MSIQGFSFAFSAVALVLSAGAVFYSRQQAQHAAQSNTIEQRRDKAAVRPRIVLTFTGEDMVANSLAVSNTGTVDVGRLELTVIGPDDRLSDTGFHDPAAPGTPRARSRVFADLRPGVPQHAQFMLVMTDHDGRKGAVLEFIGRARTEDDAWEFRATVDLPRPPASVYVM